MVEFMATILAFPTVVFTVLLAVVLFYWLFVIAGAVDLDFLDGILGLDALESAFDGAVETLDGAFESLDGAAEGAAEAGAEALDGATEGVAEAAEGADAADAAEDGVKLGTLGSLLHAMGVRGIPITIVGSLVIFWAWLLSYVGTKALGPLAASMLVGGFLGLMALMGSLVMAAVTSRPFKKIFVSHLAAPRSSLVGKMCTVLSAKVDGNCGRAEIDDGGAGFVAEVRCISKNDLKRGSKALVYRYEPREEIFFVGPVDDVLVRASGEVE